MTIAVSSKVTNRRVETLEEFKQKILPEIKKLLPRADIDLVVSDRLGGYELLIRTNMAVCGRDERLEPI